MNARAIARTVIDRHQEMLFGGLTPEQTTTAREAILPWLEAWVVELSTDEADLARLSDVVIPAELEDRYGGLDPAERYAAAVTEYDRWRLARLSEDTYARARRHASGTDGAQERTAAADADLAALREIESRLMSVPAVYRRARERLSESKLDCYYVLRGQGATSRRLARWLERRGSA